MWCACPCVLQKPWPSTEQENPQVWKKGENKKNWPKTGHTEEHLVHWPILEHLFCEAKAYATRVAFSLLALQMRKQAMLRGVLDEQPSYLHAAHSSDWL